MRKLYVLVSVLLLMATSFGCLALQTLTPTAVAPTAEAAVPIPLTPTPWIVAPPADTITDLETQVEAVYVAAGGAVVNISVTSISNDYFFNAVPQEGSGSGFVYDAQGYIVTN